MDALGQTTEVSDPESEIQRCVRNDGALEEDELERPDLPRPDGDDRGSAELVCQPELQFSAVDKLFHGAGSPEESRARLLALADRAAGRSITHWCVDLGPAYFMRGEPLRAEVPRAYFGRPTQRTRTLRTLLTRLFGWSHLPGVPDFIAQGTIVRPSSSRSPSPQRGGLFFGDRYADGLNLLLRAIYATAGLFDTPPIGGLCDTRSPDGSKGWTAAKYRSLMGPVGRGGTTVQVVETTWNAGLGPEVIPPRSFARNYDAIARPSDAIAVILDRRAGKLDELIQAQTSASPPPRLWLARQQAQDYARRNTRIVLERMRISSRGEASSVGLYPPPGPSPFEPSLPSDSAPPTRPDTVAYCNNYRNPFVRFDRTVSPPGLAECPFAWAGYPSRAAGMTLSGPVRSRLTLADYHFMLADVTLQYALDLPAGGSRRRAFNTARACAKWAMSHLAVVATFVLHEIAHDDLICGGGHCCQPRNNVPPSCLSGSAPPRVTRLYDCAHGLPGRLWRYFASSAFGLPFAPDRVSTANTLWDLTDTPSGLGGAGLFASKIQTDSRTPTGATCGGRITASHLDHWADGSRTSVSWTMNPFCLTASRRGLASSSLTYF